MAAIDDALKNLNREIERLKSNSMDGLMAAGRVIEEGARAHVPVLSGELRDSSYTRATATGTVEVGFEAEYAKIIHDDDDMKLRGDPRPDGQGAYWGPDGTADFLTKSLEENAERALQAFKDAL